MCIANHQTQAHSLSRYPSEHIIHIWDTLLRAACGLRATSWASLFHIMQVSRKPAEGRNRPEMKRQCTTCKKATCPPILVTRSLTSIIINRLSSYFKWSWTCELPYITHTYFSSTNVICTNLVDFVFLTSQSLDIILRNQIPSHLKKKIERIALDLVQA
jgi:hypothetical protein